MRKIWGVCCKGVQHLMMDELKQIRIPSLKYWIIASLPLKYKKVL
jgi:hypothetical protein